jgi:hypothetical protein
LLEFSTHFRIALHARNRDHKVHSDEALRLLEHRGRTDSHVAKATLPMSRLWTFAEGSPEVRVHCYRYTSQHSPQGWYDQAEKGVRFSEPF